VDTLIGKLTQTDARKRHPSALVYRSARIVRQSIVVSLETRGPGRQQRRLPENAACALQRPELYGAVLSHVSVIESTAWA